jgi:glycerophosphoryl diester phosphodiesterase
MIGRVSLIVLVLLTGVSNSKASPAAPPHSHSQLDVNHKKPIQTFRPYNIAHRGSNGELPEETAAAYLVTTVNSCFSQQPTSTFLFSE